MNGCRKCCRWCSVLVKVWLGEFARLMEQRPTGDQVQQHLAKQQQQCQQDLKEAAASVAETVAARKVAAALDEGIAVQLGVLDMRVDTVEAGLQSLAPAGLLVSGASAAAAAGQAELWEGGGTASSTAAVLPAASGVYAAHCAAQEAAAVAAAAGTAGTTAAAANERAAFGGLGPAYAAGQLAFLLRQVGDVQLQLLGKADKVEVEQHLLGMRQALLDVVGREEFDEKLDKKLDLEVFLASVAARQKAREAALTR